MAILEQNLIIIREAASLNMKCDLDNIVSDWRLLLVEVP